jgi:hypothetical protein
MLTILFNLFILNDLDYIFYRSNFIQRNNEERFIFAERHVFSKIKRTIKNKS